MSFGPNAEEVKCESLNGTPGDAIPPKPASAHISEDAAEYIPLELRTKDEWVAWAWHWKPATDSSVAKWDKPPIDPLTGRPTNGTSTGVRMPFERARDLAFEHGDGVGFSLGSKDSP